MSVPPKAHAEREEDAALVSRVKLRDQQAFMRLYDRYSSLVYSVALRILRREQAAEDIVQDVFSQIWNDPGRLDAQHASIGPWLAVTTRNRAIDQIRRRRDTVDVTEMDIASALDLDHSTEVETMMLQARKVIETLPSEQQSLLDLAFFQDLTHSEIAVKTGLPLGTVKTRIRSALQTLRKALT